MTKSRKNPVLRLLPLLVLLVLLVCFAFLRAAPLLAQSKAPVPGNTVLVNEVCARNLVAMTWGGRPTGDWVELRSTYDEPVSLAGWSLSDDSHFLRKFVFPEGVELNEYLVLLADGENRVDESGTIHLPFRLNAGGETLYLSNDAEDLVDTFPYPKLDYDEAFGRSNLAPDETGILLAATPGRVNPATFLEPDKRLAGQVEFSLPGGFYPDEQTVVLTSDDPDALIVYTTDGSEPTAGSHLYTGPISVTSLAGTPNRYASLPCSLDLSSENGTHWLANYAYRNAPYPVDKCTTLKARVLKDGRLGKSITSQSYWIGVEEHTLPVVSVTADADDLFGNSGIYTAGSTYFTLRRNGSADYEGNFTSDEKVSAFLSVYDSDGTIQQTLGKLSVAGQYSRTVTVLKSLGYSGADAITLDAPDGTPFTADSFVLRGSGSPDRFVGMHLNAFLNNYLYEECIGTRLNIPVVLYLENEYWGVYTLRERKDFDFFRTHFGAEPENLEFYTFSDGDAPPPSLAPLLETLGEMDPSTPEAYAWADEHFDLDGYCRYLINEMYTFNGDDLYSSGNNTTLWRDTGDAGDGRWHFLLTDLDAILYEVDRDPFAYLFENKFHPYIVMDLLFQKMWQNETFRTQFVEMFRQEMSTTYAPDQLLPAYDAWCDLLRPEIPRDIVRYNRQATPLAPLATALAGLDSVGDLTLTPENWQESYDTIHEYFSLRADEMLRYLDEYRSADP